MRLPPRSGRPPTAALRLSEIVEQRVCTEFDVEPETAQRDVEHFVEELSPRHSAGFRQSLSGILDRPDGGRYEPDAGDEPAGAGAGRALSVHFDVTYRCNERCVHCYLDHDDHGEMTTAEIKEFSTNWRMRAFFFSPSAAANFYAPRFLRDCWNTRAA